MLGRLAPLAAGAAAGPVPRDAQSVQGHHPMRARLAPLTAGAAGSVPLDSLRDESASRAYFKRHGIKKLLTDLTEGIFIDRPTQPLSYLRERIDARIMSTAALQEPTTRATSPPQAPGHGASIVRIVVECEGPGGIRHTKTLSRIVGNARMLAGAKEAAAGVLDRSEEHTSELQSPI